ncbi:hypothetical protein YC2023_050129 [Brassica napus]
MEIRSAGSKVQVPNNVAWDAKLQSIKGPDNNESQSIISCLEHNGTNKECRHKMIYLHTSYTWWYQTCYVLHMVVHAYHSNIIKDFVCVYLRSMTQYVRSDCGMADGKEEPTIMFEDEAYSAQDLHHPRIAENWRGPRDLQ